MTLYMRCGNIFRRITHAVFLTGGVSHDIACKNKQNTAEDNNQFGGKNYVISINETAA